MPKNVRFLLTVIVVALIGSCVNPVQNHHATGSLSGKSGISKPAVVLPAGDTRTVQVAASAISLPKTIDSSFIPVGTAYDVTIQGLAGGVSFGDKYATLTFRYDPAALRPAGLLEEFSVVFFDVASQTWKPVDKFEVDTVSALIKVSTHHFTTFLVAAAAAQPTEVLPPPIGISADYPLGVGGTGHAAFSLLGQGFLYYQDRDYFIRPLATSTANTATFGALGFDGALGLSTKNGASANDPVDPFSAHKLYTGLNYISFTTLRDLDVYVMYDTRGGTGPTDLSADAPWLAADGFTANISTPSHPTPTRYFVETTDSVGQYKVYKKTYAQGSVVTLDGNLHGVTDPGIQTNYWVIIKKKDDYANNSASSVSVSSSDTTAPSEVDNLVATASTAGVHLAWTPPADTDFSEVFVSYTPGGTTPFLVGQGTNSADIPGLTNGTSYTFLVRTVDTSDNISAGRTVSATPSTQRKIFYDGNGSTSGSPPVDSGSYSTGQSAVVLGNAGGLSKTGFVFGGWQTQPGEGTSYLPGQSFVLGTTNAILYAQWLPASTSLSINVTLDLGNEDAVSITVPNTVVRGTLLNVSVAQSFDSYQWYLDGPTPVGSAQTVSIATGILTPGTHTLLLAVAKNGAITSATCRFTVGNPTGLGLQIGIDLGSESTLTAIVPGLVARGTVLSLSATPGFDSYQWYLDDGQTLVGNSQAVSLTTGLLAPGSHAVLIVAAKNGVVTSATCRFTVSNPVGLGLQINVDLGSEAALATMVPGAVARGTPLNVSATTGFDSYQWYLDGQPAGSAASISLNTDGLVPGSHLLMLAVAKGGVFTSVSCRFQVTN